MRGGKGKNFWNLTFSSNEEQFSNYNAIDKRVQQFFFRLQTLCLVKFKEIRS